MDGNSKVALITGGTRGIGAGIAKALAADGYRLALNGRIHDEETQALIDQIGQSKDVIFLEGDVANANTCRTLVEQTVSWFGKIDALVHSAGGAYGGSILEVNEADWMEAFDIHVHAVFHLFRAAHRQLARAGGSVLLISSVAGLRGGPEMVPYQTVKGALPQLARAMAASHAHEGIRVNVIAPGIIETRFHANMPADLRKHHLENRIPLKSFGTVDDVADAAVALMRNAHITGEVLAIDGGLAMRKV
ncbi:MAG: SDR family oxidoreductase [Pseudomonadota bacterium]